MIELLNQIFKVCIVPLLGVLTAYIVKLVKKKEAEIDNSINNKLIKYKLQME